MNRVVLVAVVVINMVWLFITKVNGIIFTVVVTVVIVIVVLTNRRK